MEEYESTAKAKTGGLICWPIKLIMILKSLKNQLLITSLPHQNIVNMIKGNILTASQK